MTKDEFEALLEASDPDRQRAGERYEQMHRHLVTLFRNRGVTSAEEAADETINRVAKRLHEGVEIKTKIESYVRGVAKKVASEILEDQTKEVGLNNVEELHLTCTDLAGKKVELGNRNVNPVNYEDEQEIRLQRLEKCVQKSLLRLELEECSLITKYYLGEKKEKIENKIRLAAGLKCKLGTLKVRAFHIRQKVRRLMEECMKGITDSGSLNALRNEQ
jgi:DNA-directed RNA polymerase specialized sigma24 family protein